MSNVCRCPRCDRAFCLAEVPSPGPVHRLGFGWAVPCESCKTLARKASHDALKDFWKPLGEEAPT